LLDHSSIYSGGCRSLNPPDATLQRTSLTGSAFQGFEKSEIFRKKEMVALKSRKTRMKRVRHFRIFRETFIENSRKTLPFRAGMDSVATASGLF